LQVQAPALQSQQLYEIVGLPAISLWNASKEDIRNENTRLRELLEQATFTMQQDYTLKKLMEHENERLRRRLSDENLIKLSFHEWKVAIKGVFASDEFKARR